MRIVTLAVAFGLVSGSAAAQSDPGPNMTPPPAGQTIESGIAKNPDLGQTKAPSATSPSESNAVGGRGGQAHQKAAPPALPKDCPRNAADCSEPSATGTLPPVTSPTPQPR